MNLGEYLGAGSGITKGLYRLEDLTDSSGNSYNLTNNNSVGFVSGKFNNCADFGATVSNLSLTRTSSSGITNGHITLIIHLKLRAEVGANSFDFLSNADSGVFVHYYIAYEYNGGSRRLAFTRDRGSVGAQAAYYTVTLGTSSWYTLGLTYDGTNVSGFFNGSYIGQTAASGNGSGSFTQTGVSIGARLFQPANPTINYSPIYADEVVIENVAWSKAKMKKYYTDSLGRFQPRGGM